jgi:hypothetical protein
VLACVASEVRKTLSSVSVLARTVPKSDTLAVKVPDDPARVCVANSKFLVVCGFQVQKVSMADDNKISNFVKSTDAGHNATIEATMPQLLQPAVAT